MFHGIDLSSDTATKPSDAMKKAMLQAELGDEQKNEDPSTNQLQNMIADMLGFTHAVFLPSATMANQIAIAALTNPGEELIAAANSHILGVETGGPAIHARVMSRPIDTEDGTFSAAALQKTFRAKSLPQRTYSSLVSIENTSNLGGGTPWSQTKLKEITHCAKTLNLKLHMDGARFFNACLAIGEKPRTIANDFDMLTLCLTKGLGCPVGALLTFNAPHYDHVIHMKHLMGGAMRQSGILAAAGIYALKNNIDRLHDDHAHAKLLANHLREFEHFIEIKNQDTNIVLFNWKNNGISADEFNWKCIQQGVRFSRMQDCLFRAVTHLDISSHDITTAIDKVKKVINEI